MQNKNLTEEEIKKAELLSNPKAIVECLLPENKDLPQEWINGGKCVEQRPYQYLFLQYDICYPKNPKKTKQENFNIKKKTGDILLLSARGIGKNFVGIDGNSCSRMIHSESEEVSFSAFDRKHVEKITTLPYNYLNHHSYFRLFRERVTRQDGLTAVTKLGSKFLGINETLKTEPGKAWYGNHFHYNYQDETQETVEEAFNNKINARSDYGIVDMLCGITLITKNSPLSRIMKQENIRVVRLPKSISETYTEEQKKEDILYHKGEETINYKIHCEAEIIEGVSGAFDMRRVQKNYRKRPYKYFIINPDNYQLFPSQLVIEKLKGATEVYVASDIGATTAPTEIGIFFKIKNKYVYSYNISCYNLSHHEEIPNLLEWIFYKVGANFICIDATKGSVGSAVYQIIRDKIGMDKVIYCSFTDNVVVGYAKYTREDFEKGFCGEDEIGNLKFNSKGEKIDEYQKTHPFTIQKLREMLYNEQFDISEEDLKFDEQCSAYIELVQGQRVTYGSSKDDHIIQMFQTFMMMLWQTEFLPKINEEGMEDNEVSILFGVGKNRRK